MSLKALVTAAMMASMAGGAMAQSLDPVRVEMFRSILKGNECVLTEAAAGNILPRFDFTRDETRAIVGALVAAGEVRLDGSTLNLIDGSCEAEDPVAALLGQRDVQQFIAVMAENSCAMSEADAEAIFTARGITKSQVGAVVGPMIQAGMATFEAGVLTVDAAYCSAPVGAGDAPVEASAPAGLDRSGMFGLSRVRQLVDVMAENSCTLNMEVADGYLAEAGIEHGFAAFIGRKMLSDGFASMVDDENLLLSAPYCIAAGGSTVVEAQEAPIEVETPVEEPGVDMAQVALMRQIFAENGCRLSEAQMSEILPSAGFTRSSAGRVFNFLEANGELLDVDNDAVLTGDYCTLAQADTPASAPVMPVNDGTPLGAFISVAAQNSCSMDVSAAEGLLAGVDLRMDQAYRIVDDLVMDGKASLTDGGRMVSLDPSICGAVAQPVGQAETPVAPEAGNDPAQAAAESTDPRADVLAMLAANGCEVTQANVAERAMAAGLDLNEALRVLTQMMGSGEATTPDGGQTLQVGAPLCVAAAAEPMTPRAAFINLIKQNNCSVTAAEFSALLPVDGLDAATAFAMISELEAEGVITLPATRDVVTLSAEMCR